MSLQPGLTVHPKLLIFIQDTGVRWVMLRHFIHRLLWDWEGFGLNCIGWSLGIFSSFSTCYLQLRAHFTSIHLREALRKRLHETESHRSPLPLTFAFTIYGSHLENSASSPLTLTLPLESPCSNEQSSAMIPALHFHPVASSVRLASLVSWVLYKTLFPKRSFGCTKYPLPT